MARMSIDDKLLRDPRAVRLARKFGWRRQEAIGRLLDVYAVAYDRERDVLSVEDVDIAAEQPGFADAMFEVDLAEQIRTGVRIKGAAERIAYLSHKAEAGRIGGQKSGEARRNRREAERSSASSNREARGNPPDPVPDLPSVPDPVPEDQNLSPAHAIPRTPEPVPTGVPTTAVVPAPREPSLDQLWSEFELERQRVAAKLGVPWVPLLAHDQGRDDLARALVDASTAGKRAELAATVRHAIAVAGAEVETEPTKLQWFSGAIFSPRNFRRLAAAPPPKAKRKPAERAPEQKPAPIAPENLAGSAELAKAWEVLGIAKEPA